MATINKALSTANLWVKISDAGTSGSVWMHKLPTRGTVLIDHTDAESAATLPASNTNVAKNKALILRIDGRLQVFSADNGNDIYYAMCQESADAEIVSDFI